MPRHDMIRIGTRSSKLALWQAENVSKFLKKIHPRLEVQIIPIKTTGDKVTNLSAIGNKGLFLKEIEEALLEKKIDLAVHSMKDVPADLPDGLEIPCILAREDPRDVLVSRSEKNFEKLEFGCVVGTSSLRRLTQLKKKRSDLTYRDIRGNVDTRIKKMDAGRFDAVVLAAAGLKRLGLEKRITQYLDTVPAVGQGAMGIEIRKADEEMKKFVEPLNNAGTYLCVMAERAFMKKVGGDCRMPVGCLVDKNYVIRAFVSDLEGKNLVERSCQTDSKNVMKRVKSLADEILKDFTHPLSPQA